MKNVRLLYLHNFLSDFALFLPFMVIYFQQITGSYALAMAVFSCITFTSAAMEIPMGIFSDKTGRRFTMVTASFASTLAVACYAFADAPLLLFIGAFLAGISKALFSGNNEALLFETLKSVGKENEFHHYHGRAGSMFQSALAASAACAAFIADDLHLIFMLSIIPQAMATVLSFFFDEPKTHINNPHGSFKMFKDSVQQIITNPKLRLVMIGQSLSNGVGEAMFNYTTAFINTLWPSWGLALFRAANHCFGFLGFWFAGRIIDRYKSAMTLVIAEVYWTVVETVGVILSNIITPGLFLTCAFFYGPFIVAKEKILQEEFDDHQRATMGSVSSFCGNVMFGIAAILIGLTADNFGLAAGVMLGIVGCALALPFYWQLVRKH